jgi:hypothetical protein
VRADVLVCGAGRAGRAVAAACLAHRLSVIVVAPDISDLPDGVTAMSGRVVGANHDRSRSTVVLADGRIADAVVVIDASGSPPALVVAGSVDRRQRAVGIGAAAMQTDAEAAAPRVARAIAAALERRATPAAVSAAAWDAVLLRRARLRGWLARTP